MGGCNLPSLALRLPGKAHLPCTVLRPRRRCVPDSPWFLMGLEPFLASPSSLAQVLFCCFDETPVPGPLLGSGLMLGPTLQLFVLAHVESAACPSALCPLTQISTCPLSLPPPFRLRHPRQLCLSPSLCLSSQLACVYLPLPPTSPTQLSSFPRPSFLTLQAIYLASHPLVFL